MAAGGPFFLMRLVSSSVAVANRAGGIIRNILKTGSLGVVDKVCVFILKYCQKVGQFDLILKGGLNRSADETNEAK